MISIRRFSVTAAVLPMVLLLTMFSGCSKSPAAPTAPDPVANTAAIRTAEPAAPSIVGTEPGRRDGERFDGVILLEGMEEPVHYEHIRNVTVGFEMDYDYEHFLRHSEADREWFVSCWDAPENPENYLEVRYSPLTAETAAAAISETLSNDYEIRRDDSFSLDRAGRCIRIVADEIKGGGFMPDLLQTVYVIPAADGCRVATAHCAAVESEGFLRRFRYMMNTFSAAADPDTPSIPGMWQTASIGYSDAGSMQPEYYVRFAEAVILYGHLKDGQFVLDHSDKILSFGEAPAGGIRVQAEASNGVQYTYQTCESDDAVLEYYETWQEEAFPETYRGGASLSSCAQH